MFQTKGDSSFLSSSSSLSALFVSIPKPQYVSQQFRKKIAFNLPLDSVELEVVEHFKSRHQKNALDPENEEPRKSQSRQIWAQDLSSFRWFFFRFSCSKLFYNNVWRIFTPAPSAPDPRVTRNFPLPIVYVMGCESA